MRKKRLVEVPAGLSNSSPPHNPRGVPHCLISHGHCFWNVNPTCLRLTLLGGPPPPPKKTPSPVVSPTWNIQSCAPVISVALLGPSLAAENHHCARFAGYRTHLPGARNPPEAKESFKHPPKRVSDRNSAALAMVFRTSALFPAPDGAGQCAFGISKPLPERRPKSGRAAELVHSPQLGKR